MSDETPPNLGYSDVLGDAVKNPTIPSITGETVIALNRTWKIGKNVGAVKAQFEDWVRSNAIAAIQSMENTENPDFVNRAMSSYISDRAAGRYNWDGSACRSARSDVNGLVYWFFLLLRRCHPELKEETAKKIFQEAGGVQVGAALGWAVGNFSAPEGTGATTGTPTLDSP